MFVIARWAVGEANEFLYMSLALAISTALCCYYADDALKVGPFVDKLDGAAFWRSINRSFIPFASS